MDRDSRMNKCLYTDGQNDNAGPCCGELILYYEFSTNDGDEISVCLCNSHYDYYFKTHHA